jgi:hypothetical protein
MRNVQPSQVTLFLFQFKEFAQNVFSFYPRKESLDTIARLGITIPQATQEILLLTYEDYYRGPIPDTDSRKGGEYWEFGKLISGQEIFIKLKTVSESGAAICFSFHIPERQIKYPFKRGEEGK